MFDQKLGIDAAQIEALTARQHGNRDFADFGGREHELGVRRRFFQRFEERVKRRAGEHMHFVQDVDLVASRNRSVADGLVDLAHVIDAVVRGGVHLDHVEVPALHDRLAVDAQHRHVDRGPGDRTVRQLIIQRAGENARRRRFADAAHAGEDPGLRDTSGLEGVRNRAHHCILADQIGEGGWPVFACEHAIRGSRGSGLVHFRNVAWVEPAGPTQSGRPDDKLHETREQRASLSIVPGFRSAQSELQT